MKYTATIIVILLLVSPGLSSAQVSESDIAGSWKVVSIGENDNPTMDLTNPEQFAVQMFHQMAGMRELSSEDSLVIVQGIIENLRSFEDARIVLRKDGTFTASNWFEEEEEEEIGNWSFNESTQIMTFTDSKGVDESIHVERQDDVLYLLMSDGKNTMKVGLTQSN